MDITLKDKNGVTLHTAKKHCKEDINVQVETQEITITPSSNEQVQEGLFDKVIVPGVEVTEYYLDNTELIIVLSNEQTIKIDISEYLGETDLTDDQKEALNNMTVSIENGELIFEYDEEVLDLNFILENGDLIVENNVKDVDFNINQNGEMEVMY